MSPSDISNEVLNGDYKAVSPTKDMHNWSGSGIKFSDADGNQMVYIQAQRDLNITVNNCWRTIVKGNRRTKVGTDDVLEVGARHVNVIEGDQTVEIKGNQSLYVQRRRAEEIESTMSLEIGEAFSSTSKSDAINYQSKGLLSIEAKEKITIVSKGSTIELTPGQILVKAKDKTYVQPGDGGFKKSR